MQKCVDMTILKFITILSFIWATSECSKILAGRKGITKYDILEGETLTLTCKADPAHIRTYRWVYIRETAKPRVRVLSSGRRLVVGEPRFSIKAELKGEHVDIILKLTEIRPYETGLFMCWKQNQKPNPQVYVRVLEVGFSEAEPKSVEISGPNYVSFGNQAAIKCIIRPIFSGKVIWTKGDQEISPLDHDYKQLTSESDSGETLASLEITTVREDANYTCKTDTDPPSTVSFHLTVRVAKIESLSVEPRKEEIHYADTITFTCVVSGTREEILWMKDRSFIAANETQEKIMEHKSLLENGNKKSELIISSFGIEDNGQYVCYVPGDSKYVLINIEGRSSRMVGEVTWEYASGNILQFSCKIQYTKGQQVVSWLFDEEELPQDWYFREIAHEEHKNISNFRLDISILSGTLLEYIGMYTCSTPFANASTSIHELVPLIIGDAPPESIEVQEGESLFLHCSIFGYIVPMVYWEKLIDNNWKMIEEMNTDGSLETSGIEIATEFLQFDNNTMGEHQELMVKNALPKHAGQYQCKGTNDRDTVMLTTQVVVIGRPPSIIAMTADNITEGNELIITCSVENWEYPVNFSHGRSIIDPDKNPRYSLELAEEDDSFNSSNVNTFVLTITKATLADEGFYECYAGESSSSSIQAVVNPNPPEIIEIASSPAFENGELFISCTIVNMPLDKEVIFHRDNANLNYSKDARYSVHVAQILEERLFNLERIAKQATYVLKVKNLHASDSGAYDCMMDPSYQDVRATIYIEIEEVNNGEDILLEISPSNDGKSIILNCTVFKWNDEVTFFHNETMLVDDKRFEITKDIGNKSISHSLRVTDWSDRDAGRYRCFTTPFSYADVNITSEEIADMLPIDFAMGSLDFKQLIELPDESSSPKLSLQCLSPGNPQETKFIHDGTVFAQSDAMTGDFVHSRAILIHLEPKDGFVSGLQLTLSEIDSEDLGQWHCTTRYPQSNTVLNASLTVEIYVPIKFIEVPDREIEVIPGSALILNCAASGLPVVQVSWFKNDISDLNQFQHESGEKHATLQIDAFSPNDEGVYLCRATNEYEKLEYETKLSLDSRLKIIEMSPPEVIVEYGDDIDLTCIATGSTSPTVDWFKSTDDENILLTDQDFATLTLRNITSADLGVYTCRAAILGSVVAERTRIALNMTSSAISTTIAAPTLLMGRLVHISGPSDVEIGDDFTITCLISPLLDLYVAIILYNDLLITVGEDLVSSDSRLSIHVGYGGMGERLYKLTVRSSRKTDSGNYECQVNTRPLARHVHYINVMPKGLLHESYDSSDDSFLIPSGSTEAFQSPATTEISTKNVHLHTPSTFEFTPTTQAADVASNHSGGSEDVIPVIIERIGPIFASIGDTVKIPCTTTVMERPILWFEENKQRLLYVDELDLGQNPRFSLEQSIKEEINGKTNTLVISGVQVEDAGIYSCSIPYNETTSTRIEVIISSEETNPAEDLSVADKDEDAKTAIETATEISDVFENISVPVSIEIKSDEIESNRLDVTEDVTSEIEDETNLSESIEEGETDYDEYDKTTDEKSHIIETDYRGEIHEEHGDPIVTQEKGGNFSEAQKYDTNEIKSEELNEDDSSESSEMREDINIELQETASEEVQEDYTRVHIDEDADVQVVDTGIVELTTSSAIEVNDTSEEGVSVSKISITNETDIHHDIAPVEGIISGESSSAASVTFYPAGEIFDDTTKESETFTNDILDSYESTTIAVSRIASISDISTTESGLHFHGTSETYKDEIETQRPTSFVNITDSSQSSTHSYSESDAVEPTTTMRYPETDGSTGSYKISDFSEESTEIHGHPVFIANPGEDIVVSAETEVLMACPTDAVIEDITWKSEDKLLFLGSLDLAGVDGIQLSSEGQLRLLSGYPEIKDHTEYTCCVFDYDNYKDVEVISYSVNLVATKKVYTTVEAPFGAIGKWDSAVVLPGSRYSSQILSDILQKYGIKTRGVEFTNCALLTYIEGWEEARIFLNNCQTELMEQEEFVYKNVFIMLDVLATIPFSGKYVTSLVYVNSKVENISTHIYGPLTPISPEKNLIDIECGRAVYESDIKISTAHKYACKETTEKLVSVLWESYKSKLIQYP